MSFCNHYNRSLLFSTRLLARTIFCVMLLCCSLLYGNTLLHAQAPHTLRVPFSRTEITESRVRLWQNALYRWTVEGRANIGMFSQSPMVADARFFTTSLGIPTLPPGPVRLPLDANAGISLLCAAFDDMPAASPCNIYFATNALPPTDGAPTGTTAQIDPAFRIADAVQLKRYAFRPDTDEFQQNSRYQATVRGADEVTKAIFVDGLGFANNQNYNDNPADTALILRIERLSPELLILAEPNFNAIGSLPLRVLNDNAPLRVLRDTVLDFGSFLVGSGVQTRRIILKNRGIEVLRIQRIEILNPNAAFSVESSFGQLDNEVFLSQGGDSLVLTLRFQPREMQQYAEDIRIISNDSANASFTLHLRATGALGSFVPQDTIRFGNVRVGSAPATGFSIFRSAIDQTFWVDVVQQPTRAFTVGNILPQQIPAGSILTQTGFVTFRPPGIGSYLDSLVLRGRNLIDYKIYFTGHGVQASAAVYQSETAPPTVHDTLHFGALVTGASAERQLFIRNTGNLPLTVSLAVQASPNGSPDDVDDFVLGNEPSTLSEITGTVQLYRVRFAATQQIPEGRKEARLLVIVRDATNGSEVLREEITLIAQRLTNAISARRTMIDFGDIYIGTVARDTVRLVNALPTLSGEIHRQILPAPPFFADSLTQIRRFQAGDSAELRVRFQPLQIGTAQSAFVLENMVDSTRANETTRLTLRGRGVWQHFELIRITSDSLFPNNTNTLLPASALINGSRTYSADIGCVRLGERKEIRLVFQNYGNIPFAVWNQFFSLEPAQNPDFRVVREFQQGQVQPNTLDTSLLVQFSPRTEGEQEITYTLKSDIRQSFGGMVRVPTAPDSTEEIIVKIRARGILPQIAAPQAVEFDDVALGSTCANTSIQRAVITNPATDACGAFTRLTEPRLASGRTDIFRILSGQSGLTVRPGTSATIDLEFAPTALGIAQDELLITTDAPPPRNLLRISLVGRAIPLPNVVVGIDSSHAAPPGERVVIPIFVRPSTRGTLSANTQALTLTDKVRFQLSYNRTLLEYRDQITDGTASSGGVPRVDTLNQGTRQTLLVTVNAPQGARFRTNETLIRLVFTSYLGRAAETELALSRVRFGDDECAKIAIAPDDIVNGRFRLDSVCNLEEKVRTMSAIPLVVAELTPNPLYGGISTAKMSVFVREPAILTITLRDAFGIPKLVLTEKAYNDGIFEDLLSLAGLPTGIYFCEIQARSRNSNAPEIYREVKKFILLR